MRWYTPGDPRLYHMRRIALFHTGVTAEVRNDRRAPTCRRRSEMRVLLSDGMYLPALKSQRRL